MLRDYSNILVTGGSGFVGKQVVKKLLALGKRVVIVDMKQTPPSEFNSSQGSYAYADIRNREQMVHLMHNIDLVFHIAGNANTTISIQNPIFNFETNTIGTFNVLKAAQDAGVKKIVYTSSALVYGPTQHLPLREFYPSQPLNPYAASKLMGEISCLSFFHTYELPVAIARLFCIYGPSDDPQKSLVEVSRYLRWHVNHQPIQTVGDIDRKTRDFIHIDDVVDGLLCIAESGKPGEIFNVGSGQEVSMRQLIATINSITKSQATVENDASILEDSYRQVADISKLQALGFESHMSLHEGICDLLKSWGDSPALPEGETLLTHKK